MAKAEVREKVAAMMSRVGLLPNTVNQYPHEFSGGQCQRIGIARALILEPKLIICDKPVSALDVSIQAQVINLLMDLQKEMKLSLMFIAHSLGVVKHISTHVMVLYLGNAVEIGDSGVIYENPSHPQHARVDCRGSGSGQTSTSGQSVIDGGRRTSLAPVAPPPAACFAQDARWFRTSV